ncbi:Di-copper centre-containing protein [Aaosphaeria arxii CBS 175.79]|uniref:Di-copper centre-containing protein n=1 Tax=Aaosphaeria arxii CBS 175.79 TaxID=1450172 RepID=A0A6A5XX45_9PLEO|nr:Di-copper centre-containing protein [Aaosphaeria arxii CBS 175.79]KAF2017473.1 Di-copper centre-containing protein [Aaosphaeria arxii CBS 175.79]
MVATSRLVGACIALTSQMVSSAALPPKGCPAQNHGGIPMPKEFQRYQQKYRENLLAVLPTGKCTEETIGIRKSWDEIDDNTRLGYIRAVHCLASKPALTDRRLAPGAVNRLDDFTYIHINQTNIIHGSGYLLPWHRIFLTQFETALREECGYEDYLPYWDNARFSEDPLRSKVWDGSSSSMGGNGLYLKNDHGPYHEILPGVGNGNFTLAMPAGSGGGCVQDGPFQNFTISLGPVAKENIDLTNKYGYKANPRCLSRNFHVKSSEGILTWANATKIVTSPTIHELRINIESLWHKNSHTFIGKEGADPFSTTNDPAFYLLHAQIDRLWAIWQGQDLESRTYAIDGNRTFFGLPLDYAPDVPPSLATIYDRMDMGLGFTPLTLEGMPMTDHDSCFVYQ